MELTRVPGMTKGDRDKLRAGGVGTAEQLALLDLRNHRVKGIASAKLTAMRKGAQRAIFDDALARVAKVARPALESLEARLQKATWATLDAAKLAQKRAVDAVRASRGQARVLATVAADKTSDAAKSAKKEYRRLVKKIKAVPAKNRGRLGNYETQARRAADAAEHASDVARRAVHAAKKRAEGELKTAAKKGRTLVDRIRENLAN